MPALETVESAYDWQVEIETALKLAVEAMERGVMPEDVVTQPGIVDRFRDITIGEWQALLDAARSRVAKERKDGRL